MMSNNKLEAFYKKYSKYITVVLWLAVCLWRIPFINKGIDYTDTGYNMENYRNVFGSDGINGIGVFLTNLVGGLIYAVLPAYHLLVLRALHWLVGLLTTFLAYCIFKKYLDKNLILFILLGISLFAKNGESLFSYYPVTSCLLMLSLLLLIKGLEKKKNGLVFASGCVSGINVFFRLPNVLLFSAFIAIIIYLAIVKEEKKNIIKTVLIYICGGALGMLCVIPVMIIIMGFDKAVDSFMGFVRLALGQVTNKTENILGIQERSGHSLTAEIKTVAYQTFAAAKAVCLYLLPAVIIEMVLHFAAKHFEHDKNKYINGIVRVFSLTVFVVFAFLFRSRISADIMNIVGLCSAFLSVILLFAIKRKKPLYSLLFSLNILTAVTEIIGSDLGLGRFGISRQFMVLTLAVGIKYLFECRSEALDENRLKLKWDALYHFIASSIALVTMFTYVTGILCMLPKTFMDANYSELKYTVNENIKPLKGMKTSKIRAEQLNEYYEAMSNEKLSDCEVAVFGYFPLGFVIADQKDYFESVQPCIDYPAVSVESLLAVINEKQAENITPVIVVSYVNQLQRGDDHYTTEAKMVVLSYMLGLNGYDTYIDDNYYTIYVPKSLNINQ